MDIKYKRQNVHPLTPNPCRARGPLPQATVSRAHRVRCEVPAPPSPSEAGEGSLLAEMAYSHFSGD